MMCLMATRSSAFPSTRLSLFQKLPGGEEKAWSRFFNLYGPVMYRMARRAGLRGPDAEDVVAAVVQAFVGRVKRGFQVDQAKGRFRDYLRAATNNEIRLVVHRARRGTDPRVAMAVASRLADTDFEQAWEEVETVERLRSCLAHLRQSPSVRRRDVEAFERWLLGGESPARVAKAYQITVNRLYGIKFEMIQRLRRMMVRMETQFVET